MLLKFIILVVALIIIWPIAKQFHHKWRQKQPICAICDSKIDTRTRFGKGQRWYCARISEPGKEPGKYYYKPICGVPRVKTSPVWCPKRKSK